MLVEMSEVRECVDAVGEDGLSEAVEVGTRAGAALGVDEQPGAPSDGKRPDVILDAIVMCRDVRMLEEASQLRPLSGCVRECFAQGALGWRAGQQLIDPRFEGRHDGRRAGLADVQSLTEIPGAPAALTSFLL